MLFPVKSVLDCGDMRISRCCLSGSYRIYIFVQDPVSSPQTGTFLLETIFLSDNMIFRNIAIFL